MTTQVLMLDVGFQPIGICSWERAITLWFENKVEIIEEYVDNWLHSAKLTIRMPSVIRFIKKVVKKTRKVKFSRDSVYLRDKGQCQYCGIQTKTEEFTLDHIIPKSKNGKTTWENVCVCCIECNRFKANRTPQQAKMKLKSLPIKPKNLFQTFNWKSHFPMSWQSWLYWNQELVQN